MASYNVQNFTYDGPGDSLCYGKQDDHNHDKQVKFTTDIKTYLENNGATNVDPGPFRSHQPEPADGKEFRWNGTNWVRV